MARIAVYPQPSGPDPFFMAQGSPQQPSGRDAHTHPRPRAAPKAKPEEPPNGPGQEDPCLRRRESGPRRGRPGVITHPSWFTSL